MIATYLRVDVPLLLDPATYGPYVLYTDTDVLFLREMQLSDFGIDLGLSGRAGKVRIDVDAGIGIGIDMQLRSSGLNT